MKFFNYFFSIYDESDFDKYFVLSKPERQDILFIKKVFNIFFINAKTVLFMIYNFLYYNTFYFIKSIYDYNYYCFFKVS